jgi:hypothetical protein
MMRQGHGLRTVAALAVYSYVLLLAGKWIGTGSNEGRVGTGRFSPGHGGGVVDGHHGPIDAVYTWVNGSDEVWLREMSKWKQRLGLEALVSAHATPLALHTDHPLECVRTCVGK